jgi:putative membrane protein
VGALWHDAALSYLHFVFAFILVGAIAAEAFVLRLPVDGRVARLLLRIDLFYGVSAVGVILAGVARVFWGAKGADFYSGQPLFWAKMATFAVVGLISIAPTRAFFRWVRAASQDAAHVVSEAEARRTRRLVLIELHVLALVPLFAALMARAIGS